MSWELRKPGSLKGMRAVFSAGYAFACVRREWAGALSALPNGELPERLFLLSKSALKFAWAAEVASLSALQNELSLKRSVKKR